jgi:8-oxo-dGTP diphosphatase
MNKPIIYVVGCVFQNAKGEVLLVQRPENKPMALMWEFPGGKIEPGELPENALAREIFEEINLSVNPQDLIPFTFISHSYETFHLVMLTYKCTHWEGEMILKENQKDYKWLPPERLGEFLLPEADLPIIELLMEKNGKEPAL